MYDDLEQKKDAMSTVYLDWERLHRASEDAEKQYSERNASKISMEFSQQISFTYAKAWERAMPYEVAFLPNWKRNLLGGAFMSLVLAILSVIGLDKLDDTVRTPKDLQRKQGLYSMGMIPANPTPLTDAEAYTLVQHKSFSLMAEALRNLHIGLEVKYGAHRTGQPLVVTVTSALANEGKSMVSSNLALLFAGLGRKVLLVDADLRKRSISRVYKCENKVGDARCHARDAVVAITDCHRIDSRLFPAAGGHCKTRRFGHHSAGKFRAGAGANETGLRRDHFRHAARAADGGRLHHGAGFDVTVLVVRSRKTSMRQVETATSNLTTANVKEIGCVVNGVDDDDASAGAYIYGYGYGYGYGLEPEKPARGWRFCFARAIGAVAISGEGSGMNVGWQRRFGFWHLQVVIERAYRGAE